MTTSTSDHWSDYWSRGCLTSLPQDFAANYDGEVAAFWAQQFRDLPADGQVLDLCTGNGAIALLAARHARDHAPGIGITAVDAARISTSAIAANHPGEAGLLSGIRFIGESRVEDLDLPDARFDLVTSQYGIEYCDWNAAAATVYRLLKAGGRLVMVAHTATSDIMKFMEREHAEYQLLEQLNFFSSISGYLAGILDFRSFHAALSGVHASLEPEFRRTGSALYRSVLGMLTGAVQMDQATMENGRTHLQHYEVQLRFGWERLQDMLRVNRAIAGDPQWHRVFEAAGLKPLGSGELRYRGEHHAGAWFSLGKPASRD